MKAECRTLEKDTLAAVEAEYSEVTSRKEPSNQTTLTNADSVVSVVDDEKSRSFPSADMDVQVTIILGKVRGKEM